MIHGQMAKSVRGFWQLARLEAKKVNSGHGSEWVGVLLPRVPRYLLRMAFGG